MRQTYQKDLGPHSHLFEDNLKSSSAKKAYEVLY